MSPESPTWKACSEMRQSCQSAIFEKLDEQHGETMTAIGSIRETIAGMKGEARGAEKVRGETGQKFTAVKALNLTTREIVMIIAAIGSLVTSVIIAMHGKTP